MEGLLRICHQPGGRRLGRSSRRGR
jgi:hypothetical protein